jgi:hypothetical protein
MACLSMTVASLGGTRDQLTTLLPGRGWVSGPRPTQILRLHAALPAGPGRRVRSPTRLRTTVALALSRSARTSATRGIRTAEKYRNTGRISVDGAGLWRTNDHCSEQCFQTSVRRDLYFASRGSGFESPKCLARCTLGLTTFYTGFKGAPPARHARAEPAQRVGAEDAKCRRGMRDRVRA